MAGNDSSTDQTKTKTKLLMSLNERLTRFHQDLPSSCSKPPPAVSFSLLSPDENDSAFSAENARLRLSANSPSGEGNIPNFSGITDFDSPYDDPKRSQLNKEAPSRSSSDVVDDRCVSTHEQVATSDATEDEEKEKGNDKPYKVKIAGRRRLCKLSSSNTTEQENPVELNSALNISDFSSPPPTRTVKDEVSDIGGGNEIRDILSDLSARLGLLSIEKRPMPKIFDHQPAPFNRNDPGEYATAASSFASSSSPSSSDVDKKDSDKDKRKVQTKSMLTNTTSIPDETDGDDSEGDCVILRDEELSGDKKKINTHTSFAASIAVVIPEEDEEAADKVALEDEHAITLKGLRYTYKLPGQIGKMLFPHQREGLKWLWSLHCLGKGGILGDDMGLGKTMQICGYLAGLFHSRLIKRVIIVAPKTLIPHWIKELTAVGISHKIKEYFGTCPKARQYELQFVLQDEGVLLTTYDIVRNNWKSLCHSSFQDDDSEDVPLWDYMILDEGHLIKNPSTQRAQSLLQIPCAHRIIISGTPLQNNLKELWALFNFCCPDLLGDKKWFKEHYEYPILRGNEKRATERERHVGSVVAKKLREHFQPYFLRRLKSEVFGGANASGTAELSKKNEVIVWLRLTHCQRHLYEAFLKSELVLSAFDGSPLAAITILKKICDHPYLLTKRAAEDVLEGMDSMLNAEDHNLAAKLAMRVAEYTEEDEFQEKHDNVSCKISFIMQLLDNLIPEGHSVLIFSQTRKMLNLIQESLVSSGFDFLRIDGTTKSSDRLKIVNDFQEGRGASIFLLTSQVGGLGLTLTRADRVIVVDPAWNPSTDSQSVDRAYRIGQKKDVLVYRLMTCGTIEEKVYRMQIFKGGLFRTATEQKEQTRYFSQQDLKELFSLPRDGFDISPTQQQLHEEHGHQIVMSDTLKGHIKFLESLGIGGVSHHSLLYSKTEPTPSVQEEVDLTRRKESATSYRYTNPSRVPERPLDGAEFSKFAFNPKDAKTQPREKVSPGSSSKLTESDIKERISRLSGILTNKATVSKLPDGGRKIQRQIEELKHELDSIRRPKQGTEVIEIDDDVADALQRSLYVR